MTGCCVAAWLVTSEAVTAQSRSGEGVGTSVVQSAGLQACGQECNHGTSRMRTFVQMSAQLAVGRPYIRSGSETAGRNC